MIKATVGREVAEAIDGSWVLKIEMLALSILILSKQVQLNFARQNILLCIQSLAGGGNEAIWEKLMVR